MNCRPFHSSQTRRTRATALLMAISLLVGLLMGSGLAQWARERTPLSSDAIAQLILQDMCRAHSEVHAETPSDEKAPPLNSHNHCAVCLIVIDIALPEHGGTWRFHARALAMQQVPADRPSPPHSIHLKPPSHAPPLSV